MKLWNKCIYLSSRKSLLMLSALLISSLLIASVWPEEVIEDIQEEEMWVPTADDIAYQDSMYTIIKNTQNDVNDIKEDIVLILERLDYADGSYDSIRYIKGGKIDKRRN